MKPRNFPERKLRRQVRAYRRKFAFPSGILLKQSHEAFVLHGIVPNEYREPPIDIRVRIGGKRRLDGERAPLMKSGRSAPGRRRRA